MENQFTVQHLYDKIGEELFFAVGWATEETTTQEMIDNFNVGFINSTFVFSAWDGERLVGCVRVLSDLHFRSIIYDLAVLPEYQNNGIGSELIRRLFFDNSLQVVLNKYTGFAIVEVK